MFVHGGHSPQSLAKIESRSQRSNPRGWRRWSHEALLNLSEQEREARYILGPLSDIVGALGCLFYQKYNTTAREGDKMSR